MMIYEMLPFRWAMTHMKYILPLLLILLGLRVWSNPLLTSRIYRVVLDLTGYNVYIGIALFLVGVLLLVEALGLLKKR